MRKSFILSFIFTVLFITAETLLFPRGDELDKSEDNGGRLALPSEPTYFFGEAENGCRRAVAVGATICVELPENATTGYHWEVNSVDSRVADVVRVISMESIGAPSPQGMTGVPGVYKLLLRVEKTGIYPVTLAYVRPWEKGVAPARVWHMEIEGVE